MNTLSNKLGINDEFAEEREGKMQELEGPRLKETKQTIENALNEYKAYYIREIKDKGVTEKEFLEKYSTYLKEFANYGEKLFDAVGKIENLPERIKEYYGVQAADHEIINSHSLLSALPSIYANQDNLNKNDQEGVKMIYQYVKTEIERVEDLIPLLEIRDLPTKQICKNAKKFKLNELIQKEVDSYKIHTEPRNVTVDLDLQDIEIKTHYALARGIISTLYGNAAKNASKGGKIEVGLKKGWKNIELTIKNNYISGETLEHLGRNKGIGTYLVDKLIETTPGADIDKHSTKDNEFIVKLKIPKKYLTRNNPSTIPLKTEHNSWYSWIKEKFRK